MGRQLPPRRRPAQVISGSCDSIRHGLHGRSLSRLLTARGVTTMDAAAGAALGTGGGAIGGVLGATRQQRSRAFRLSVRTAATGAGDRRGNATAATTSTTAAARVTARSRVAALHRHRWIYRGRCPHGPSRLDRRRHRYTRLLHGRLCSPRLSGRLFPTRAASLRRPPPTLRSSSAHFGPLEAGGSALPWPLDTAMHVPVVSRQSSTIADHAVTNR